MNVIYKFQSLYFNTDQKNHDLKSLGKSLKNQNEFDFPDSIVVVTFDNQQHQCFLMMLFSIKNLK